MSLRMEQRKFETYDDTCFVEKTSFLVHGGKLRKLLEGDENIIFTSYGQGIAVHYIMNSVTKKEMLKLFIDEPKKVDAKSTL